MRLSKSSMRVVVAAAFGGLIVIMAGTPWNHVVASTRPAPAAAQPSADLLKSEQADLQAFGTQMRELVKLVDGVDEKAKPTKAEADALARQAAVVKRLLPAYQRALSSSIGKIKAAGKWTQELDARVERRSPARASVLRTSGGARAVLEKGATDPDLTNLERTLDDYIREINGRGVIARLIDELTGVPVLAKSALGNAIRKLADAVDVVVGAATEVARDVCFLATAGAHCGD